MVKYLIFLIFLLNSCAQKRTFRRPERRIEPSYTKIRVSDSIKKEYRSNEENVPLEDQLIENELETYFDSLKSEEEIEFFELGKKAIDLRVFFTWPTGSRRITSSFGFRNHPITKKWHMHKGIDIGGKSGNLIFASQKGKVLFSKKSKTYGNVIAIAHGRGFVSLYAHNKENLVKKGASVLKNQKIAIMGQSGLATAPHLHFEIRRYKKHLNPYDFFNNQKKYFTK